MELIENCPICLRSSKSTKAPDAQDIKCPRCGSFRITGTAITVAVNHDLENSNGKQILGPPKHRRRANASAWIYRHPGEKIGSNMVYELAGLESPSVLDRVDIMLRQMASECEGVGKAINVGEESWMPRTYSVDRHEVHGLAGLLSDLGRITVSVSTTDLSNILAVITAEGWRRLEEMGRVQIESTQGFVAMWFRPSLNRLYDEAIAPAIDAAGYDALRVDDLQHIDKIDDRIVAEIRQSRFLVADYTGRRGGVYWEAGFAFGLGIPVVMTCCKREIKKLHFDIRQYNCIDWTSRSDLRERLENRIKAVIGPGPKLT